MPSNDRVIEEAKDATIPEMNNYTPLRSVDKDFLTNFSKELERVGYNEKIVDAARGLDDDEYGDAFREAVAASVSEDAVTPESYEPSLADFLMKKFEVEGDGFDNPLLEDD